MKHLLKTVLLFSGVLLTLPGCSGIVPDSKEATPKAKKDGYDYVFDKESLPTVTIEIKEEDWNKFLSNYDKDPKNTKYVHCDFSFEKGDEAYDILDTGLRLRGQTSRRRPEGSTGSIHKKKGADWNHVHFGINFRKYHKGDKDYDIKGVQRINLKYFHEDPSYVREMYCFDYLRRMGIWTALDCSYCRLFIHVEGDAAPVYYGVYMMQEAVDDEFLERRAEQFGGDDGFLWKCGWGADLNSMADGLFQIDDDSGEDKAYELKENTDEFNQAKIQIKDFIKNLQSLKGGAFENWISKVCDVDLLLKTYAANVLLGQWDDYWNDMNNFYIYFNSQDAANYRVYMICYDYDNTLGTSHNCGVQTDSGRHDPFNWGLPQCNLISKIIAIPEYKELYTKYLREFALEKGNDFVWEASHARIDGWQDMIRDFVANDTGEDNSIYDRPASWSNHQEYRIMTDGTNNWFRVKVSYLNDKLK